MTVCMMQLGVGLECARDEGEDVATALARAADCGYRWVEAYVFSELRLPVNSHLVLATSSPYHHFNAALADAADLRRQLAHAGVQLSALDAHSTLLLPQVGVPYLRAALDLAADLECPIVMSDEGPVALEWMDLDRAFDLLCFTIEPVVRHARHRGVRFAIELHNALTARPEYLVRLLERFGPDELGVNFDTGNCFLAGNDPVEYLRAVATRVVHVHVKDIPATQLAERGKVTGTRVGVAAGEGVVDLPGILGVLAAAGYPGVLSVECGTWAQARTSRQYLERLLGDLAP